MNGRVIDILWIRAIETHFDGNPWQSCFFNKIISAFFYHKWSAFLYWLPDSLFKLQPTTSYCWNVQLQTWQQYLQGFPEEATSCARATAQRHLHGSVRIDSAQEVRSWTNSYNCHETLRNILNENSCHLDFKSKLGTLIQRAFLIICNN